MMIPPRIRFSKVLTMAGVAAFSFAPSLAEAQRAANPNDANISTGSGAGTDPGVDPGSFPSAESPTTARPGLPGLPEEFGGPRSMPAPGLPNLENPTYGPPYNSNPNEIDGPPTSPFDDATGLGPNISGLSGFRTRTASPEQVKAVNARLMAEARAIGDPADRALSFDRVARAKVVVDEWEEALQALTEGGQAAITIRDPLIRDVRLEALTSTAIGVAEELVREATIKDVYRDPLDNRPPRTLEVRMDYLRTASRAVALGGNLAFAIRGEDYRSLALFNLVQDQATNSRAVSRFAQDRDSGLEVHSTGELGELREMADSMLVEAEREAVRIPLPVWRDQALVRVASAAASSGQYTRGLMIARKIPQPESRADAQIHLAEMLARSNHAQDATAAYQEAVRSVVSIPLEDPRASLGAVLLDSLLAVGRFEDARSASMLIQDPLLRARALGAVAKAMGERGLVSLVEGWISSETGPDLRDRLRREASEGYVDWLQRSRPNPNTSLMPDILPRGMMPGVLPPIDDMGGAGSGNR